MLAIYQFALCGERRANVCAANSAPPTLRRQLCAANSAPPITLCRRVGHLGIDSHRFSVSPVVSLGFSLRSTGAVRLRFRRCRTVTSVAPVFDAVLKKMKGGSDYRERQ